MPRAQRLFSTTVNLSAKAWDALSLPEKAFLKEAARVAGSSPMSLLVDTASSYIRSLSSDENVSHAALNLFHSLKSKGCLKQYSRRGEVFLTLSAVLREQALKALNKPHWEWTLQDRNDIMTRHRLRCGSINFSPPTASIKVAHTTGIKNGRLPGINPLGPRCDQHYSRISDQKDASMFLYGPVTCLLCLASNNVDH
jgi:hypothetical protein